MESSLFVLIRSARVYMWPFIAINVGTVSWTLEAGIGASMLIASILALLASFGFVVNDLVDRPIDRFNRRERLQNQSLNTCFAAVALAIACAIGAVLLGWCVAQYMGIALVAVLIAGLLAYSFALRPVPFVATTLASILCISTFWFPMILFADNVTDFHYVLLRVSIVGIFAREIILDVKDIRGDRKYKRKTIPVLCGARFTSILALMLITLSGIDIVHFGLLNHNALIPYLLSLVAVVMFWLVPLVPVVGKPIDTRIERFVVWSRVGIVAVPCCLLVAQELAS